MKTYRIEEFTKGWFIGDFSPTIIPSKDVEVAIKVYKAGDYDKTHFHKIAEEVTVIVYGMVSMNNKLYKAGDVILIEKNEATDFKAISDAMTCVVKVPFAKNDKYEVDQPQG